MENTDLESLYRMLAVDSRVPHSIRREIIRHHPVEGWFIEDCIVYEDDAVLLIGDLHRAIDIWRRERLKFAEVLPYTAFKKAIRSRGGVSSGDSVRVGHRRCMRHVRLTDEFQDKVGRS